MTKLSALTNVDDSLAWFRAEPRLAVCCLWQLLNKLELHWHLSTQLTAWTIILPNPSTSLVTICSCVWSLTTSKITAASTSSKKANNSVKTFPKKKDLHNKTYAVHKKVVLFCSLSEDSKVTHLTRVGNCHRSGLRFNELHIREMNLEIDKSGTHPDAKINNRKSRQGA